jgi:hypothetical protein
MMRFTAFPEIQLNLDMGDCRWAKLTHRAAITRIHRAYIFVWVPRNTHPQRMSLEISPVPPEPPKPLMPWLNRVSRKALKRIKSIYKELE